MRKIKTYFPFTFFLFIFLLVSCSSPTSTPKGNLTGVVHLESLSDHSSIIVALYDLAELDPEIVSINSQYPHIGVIITQHTEFDHRLQEPVKYTETDAEGYFEIKKIPTGIYNIVALKDSFGFKYLYEFEIEKGENQLTPQSSSRRGEELTPRPPLFSSIEGEIKNKDGEIPLFKGEQKGVNPENRTSDLTLYPETTYSGVITENLTFETDHHYIIDDDTDVLSSYSLTIQPGAVIRINPGVDFRILGTITAQGEENNMFWVTTNAGFLESLMPNVQDSLAIYNSLELSSIATVENDLIEWGKFDYASTSLLNQVNNLHIQNGIFRDAGCGFKSTNVDSIFCYNSVFLNNTEKGIYFIDHLNGKIQNNVLINNCNACEIKHRFCGSIINNYIDKNEIGCKLWSFHGSIEHNIINQNMFSDIWITGNNDNITETINVIFNNFSSNTGIYLKAMNSYGYLSPIIINNNNFRNDEFFISYCSVMLDGLLDARYNFFNNIIYVNDILERIIDNWYDPEINHESIIIEPFNFNPILNAGII